MNIPKEYLEYLNFGRQNREHSDALKALYIKPDILEDILKSVIINLDDLDFDIPSDKHSTPHEAGIPTHASAAPDGLLSRTSAGKYIKNSPTHTDIKPTVSNYAKIFGSPSVLYKSTSRGGTFKPFISENGNAEALVFDTVQDEHLNYAGGTPEPEYLPDSSLPYAMNDSVRLNESFNPAGNLKAARVHTDFNPAARRSNFEATDERTPLPPLTQIPTDNSKPFVQTGGADTDSGIRHDDGNSVNISEPLRKDSVNQVPNPEKFYPDLEGLYPNTDGLGFEPPERTSDSPDVRESVKFSNLASGNPGILNSFRTAGHFEKSGGQSNFGTAGSPDNLKPAASGADTVRTVRSLQPPSLPEDGLFYALGENNCGTSEKIAAAAGFHGENIKKSVHGELKPSNPARADTPGSGTQPMSFKRHSKSDLLEEMGLTEENMDAILSHIVVKLEEAMAVSAEGVHM